MRIFNELEQRLSFPAGMLVPKKPSTFGFFVEKDIAAIESCQPQF